MKTLSHCTLQKMVMAEMHMFAVTMILYWLPSSYNWEVPKTDVLLTSNLSLLLLQMITLSIGLESVDIEITKIHRGNITIQGVISASPYDLCQLMTWFHPNMPFHRYEFPVLSCTLASFWAQKGEWQLCSSAHGDDALVRNSLHQLQSDRCKLFSKLQQALNLV